jgi:RNA polymerase sigma-70 factor (ECF subfamily)
MRYLDKNWSGHRAEESAPPGGRGRHAPHGRETFQDADVAPPVEPAGTGGASAETENPPLTAEQVFHDYAPRVYSLAWRMLGNDADAEDVAQDVLLQVVRKLDSFRGESAFTTWLHRVTVNAALALRRRRAVCKERQMSDPLDRLFADDGQARRVGPWSPLPERQVLDRELRQLIEKAIAGLPPLYRDVYVLADVEGMSNAEVGELLGLTLAAVKSRLHRGRLLMREALAPHFEEVEA